MSCGEVMYYQRAQGTMFVAGVHCRALIFRRRIKSRLPFAGIISLPYSTRFQDRG